jgi:hypothetical protein
MFFSSSFCGFRSRWRISFLSLTLLGLPLQAVHLAARSGHTDVFKLLLDAGGRVDVNNREGKSPFFYAQQYKALKPLVIKKPPAE